VRARSGPAERTPAAGLRQAQLNTALDLDKGEQQAAPPDAGDSELAPDGLDDDAIAPSPYRPGSPELALPPELPAP
jgi:hypothetical protein